VSHASVMAELDAFGQHIGARAVGADDLAMGGEVEIDTGMAQALGAVAVAGDLGGGDGDGLEIRLGNGGCGSHAMVLR
jgi:hypothetical protein